MSNRRAELRRRKKQEQKSEVKYTFTAAQLEERDRAIIDAYLEHIKAEAMLRLQAQHEAWDKDFEKKIQDIWDERARLFRTPDLGENFFNMLQYMLSVPSRVLIEKFGWKPVPKENEPYRLTKMERFAREVAAEIDRIGSDDMMDIRRYAEETYNLYGVKYTR